MPQFHPIPFFIGWLAIGLVGLCAFSFNSVFPLWFSVFVFLLASTYLVQLVRKGLLGMLVLVLWLFYALPFIHIVPYLWFDFDWVPPIGFGRLVSNPYMFDEQVILLMSMIGAVGAIGICIGATLATRTRKVLVDMSQRTFSQNSQSLSLTLFFCWIAVSLGLAWLAAPQETLFTSEYTDSSSVLDGFNFSSAWMISYFLLLFCISDAVHEKANEVRIIKFWSIVMSLVVIVLFLNLLRGNRDSLPLVLSAFLIAFYWGKSNNSKSNATIKIWLLVVFSGISLVVIGKVVGSVRHSLVGVESFSKIWLLLQSLYAQDILGPSTFLYGTWSAALLTPLSIAGDYIYTDWSYQLGRSYVNLIASFPPGFLADFIGYVRPLDINDPASQMRYGIGGTHAVVLPFKNFGMLGVLLIPVFWTYAILRLEERTKHAMNVSNMSFLGAIVLIAPHWLWYGEKILVNAIVIWIALSFLYRLSKLERFSAASQ